MADNNGSMNLPIGEWLQLIGGIIKDLASNHLLSRKAVMVAMGLGAFCYCLQQISQITLDKVQFWGLMAVILLICGGLPAFGIWRQADIDKLERTVQDGEIVEIVKPENEVES